jgi:hypothetical protein
MSLLMDCLTAAIYAVGVTVVINRFAIAVVDRIK